MTTSVEFDGVPGSWESDFGQPADETGDPLFGHGLAQAAVSEPVPQPADPAAGAPDAVPAASGEPVPVDAGSGTTIGLDAAGAVPPSDQPTEYVADAGNVVRLPANVSIENIRVEGADLVLEQADGTQIVIKDAAANVPTFVLGEFEVPRVALLAALEGSGIDVAFGADGSINASPGANPPNSSGGNFGQPPGDIGDGFDLTALLPPTALAFPQYEEKELYIGLTTEVDEAISFSISASPDTISEEGQETATFTLSVTGFPLTAGNTATVNLAASGGATGGTDYTPALLTSLNAALPTGVSLSGSTLTFTDAYTGADIVFTVAAVNDNLVEGSETIVATLSSPTISNGTAGLGTASDTVTITETDVTNIIWSLTANGSEGPTRNTVLEGALASYSLAFANIPSPGATYTVQLSVNFTWVDPAGDKANASAADITAAGTQNSVLQALADSINAAGVSGITASFTPGNTYVTVSALNPAATSVTFNLPALDDTIFENTEDFGVVIASPSANSSIDAAADDVTTNIVNTDAPPDVSLLGVLVINEIGLNASTAQSFKVGGTDYVIPAGLSYIEIKNLSTNASDTSGSKVPTLRLEITDGTDTVYISLSTLGAIDAKNYLVLYENGTWVEYEANGAPKQAGTYTYFNPVTQTETSAADGNWESVMPAGSTTSDPVGVSLYQKTAQGIFTVDGFLANGVNIGSDNGTLGDPDNKLTLGNVIWNGASGNLAPASATTLLGSALTQNSQYNGSLGDQYQVALTLGLSSLLPIQFIDDNAATGVQNTDSTSLIYAREFNPTAFGGTGAQPGDDNRADQPVPTDTNRESDWTVTYGNTHGKTNQVAAGIGGTPDSANPQDSSDETDPDQGFKDGNLDNSGVDAQFGGQSVLIASGNDTAFAGQFRGGDGQDYLYGTTGNDSMFGGNNNDLLFGNSGNDTLRGEAGADLLVDILGQDTLQGGTGDDTLISGSELKLWSGGAFVDTKTLPGWDVAGSQTALVLDGIALTGFEDILDGGAGNDILIGGLGDDQLIGDLGADFLSGSGGANLLDISEATQSRDIVQFTGEALDALDADDLIVGFNTANDVIDLSELFDVAAGKTIADYADIDGSALKIDVTGSGGAGGWNTIATFQSAPVGAVSVLYNNNGTDDTNGTI